MPFSFRGEICHSVISLAVSLTTHWPGWSVSWQFSCWGMRLSKFHQFQKYFHLRAKPWLRPGMSVFLFHLFQIVLFTWARGVYSWGHIRERSTADLRALNILNLNFWDSLRFYRWVFRISVNSEKYDPLLTLMLL